MSDLFAPQPPAYGSLSPSDERSLYDNDRPMWFAYVAPTTAAKLTAGGAESIRIAWPMMSREYQHHIWGHLDNETRELVRLVRETA